LKLQVS